MPNEVVVDAKDHVLSRVMLQLFAAARGRGSAKTLFMQDGLVEMIGSLQYAFARPWLLPRPFPGGRCSRLGMLESSWSREDNCTSMPKTRPCHAWCFKSCYRRGERNQRQLLHASPGGAAGVVGSLPQIFGWLQLLFRTISDAECEPLGNFQPLPQSQEWQTGLCHGDRDRIFDSSDSHYDALKRLCQYLPKTRSPGRRSIEVEYSMP